MKINYSQKNFFDGVPKQYEKHFYEGVNLAGLKKETVRVEITSGYHTNNCLVQLLVGQAVIDMLPDTPEEHLKLINVSDGIAELLRRNGFEHLIEMFI